MSKRHADLTYQTEAAKRIWAAVLGQAIDDLLTAKEKKHRQSAERFLMTSDSDEVFAILGIDAVAARKRIAAGKIQLTDKRGHRIKEHLEPLAA